MTEKIEYRGYWWRPDESDNQVAGILTFIPNEKIELELLGSFDKECTFSQFFHPKKEMVIHGLTDDSKKITLFVCNFRSSHSSSSFPVFKYLPRHMIVGKYLSDIDEQTFNKLTVFTPVMNSWLHPRVINYSMSTKEADPIYVDRWKIERGKSIGVKYEKPIDNEFNLRFRALPWFKMDQPMLNININQATAFEFRKQQGKASLLELAQKMHLFLDFLTFASLGSVPIEELVLYDDDYGQSYNGKMRIEPINWYYSDRRKPANRAFKDIDCLFTYEQVSGVFESLIQKWYSDSDTIAPLRQHLVDSIIGTPYFDSGNFLIAVQALEGYHRRFVNSKKLPLNKRLKYLVDEFKFVDLINLTDDDIEAIVQSRDYYSHFFMNEEKPLLMDGKELFLKYIHLRILLICCIMRLIGLNDNTILKLIKDCNNRILNTSYS